MRQFLGDILSPQELQQIDNRWRACQLLLDGDTQRVVSRKLKMSIATVTRAQRLLNRNRARIARIREAASQLVQPSPE